MSKITLTKASLGQLSLSIAGLMMMTACTSNFDSNALKNHPLSADKRAVNSPEDLRKQEAQKEIVYVDREVVKEVIRNQPLEVQKNFQAAQLFQIINVNPVSFVAGSEGQIKFEARVLHGTAQFTVQAEGLPSGAVLKEVATEANKKTYVLTYKPASNSIQNNAIEETKSFKLRLNLTSLVHEDKEKESQLKQAFSNVDRSKAFDMIVRRDRSNPKIEAIEIPEVVAEGETRAVKITVIAPGTYEGFAPTLVFLPYKFTGFNAGLLENNGSSFLVENPTRAAAEYVSEGKWIFNLDIDAKAGLIPQQLNQSLQPVASDAVLFRSDVKVISATGSTSDIKTIKYKISVKRGAQ